MKITPKEANAFIRNRRAIFPPMYNGRTIPDDILQQILENANWAPTHKLTEPWRFRVFRGRALKRVGEFLANHYQQNTAPDKFSDIKYKKTYQKAQQSSAVIAICMQRDPEQRIPEWEEIASVACAVQNMWLSATAYGIGAYWSSPKAINQASELFDLAEGERCLGFFYMGYTDINELEGRRGPIEDKVIWIED